MSAVVVHVARNERTKISWFARFRARVDVGLVVYECEKWALRCCFLYFQRREAEIGCARAEIGLFGVDLVFPLQIRCFWHWNRLGVHLVFFAKAAISRARKRR